MRQGGEHVEFAAVSVERLADKRRQQRTMPRKALCEPDFTVAGKVRQPILCHANDPAPSEFDRYRGQVREHGG